MDRVEEEAYKKNVYNFQVKILNLFFIFKNLRTIFF
jgi:hypothetical protein